MTQRKRIKLSNGRRLVCDIVRLANKVPSYGLISEIDVRALAKVRRQIKPRLSWSVIMMKAYARLGCRIPELRQHYVSFPWPQIYQHDKNIAMMVVGREHMGEERLFFARFASPEEEPLLELQKQLDYYNTAPVMEIRLFRKQIRFARIPTPLRRLIWWVLVNVWSRRAPRQLGTFGVSLSGRNGVVGTQHLSPVTSTLGVDSVSRGGISRTLLTFDHRIFDAVPAYMVFNGLVRELRGPIMEEMQQIAAAQAVERESASGGVTVSAEPVVEQDGAGEPA